MSSEVIRFTVPGPPVPWARHKGMGAWATTPAKQRSYKNTVAQYAWAQPGGRGKALANCPLWLECRIFITPPKGLALAAAWLADDSYPVIARPDLDNWLKLPMDAMNGLVWADDAQVVCLDGSGKFYSANPRLEIVVRHFPVAHPTGDRPPDALKVGVSAKVEIISEGAPVGFTPLDLARRGFIGGPGRGPERA